jgi:hypothetical protein
MHFCFTFNEALTGSLKDQADLKYLVEVVGQIIEKFDLAAFGK